MLGSLSFLPNEPFEVARKFILAIEAEARRVLPAAAAERPLEVERPYPHRAIWTTSYVGPNSPVTRLTVMPHVGLSGISDEDWEADGTTVGPLHPCAAVLSTSIFQCRKWAIVSLLVIPPSGEDVRVRLCGSHFTRHRSGHAVVAAEYARLSETPE